MKLLVGHSGGYDSTYLLWLVLRATIHEVHAVYFDFSGVDIPARPISADKIDAERAAVAITREKLRKLCRPFEELTISVAKMTGVARGEWGQPTMIRLAAKLTKTFDFQGYAYGRTLENMTGNRGAKLTPHYKRLFEENAAPGAVLLWPLIDHRVGRPHALAEMPSDILDAIQSCDAVRVVGGRAVPCGTCIKCRTTREFKAALASGKTTADELFDKLLRSKGAGPYDGLAPAEGYRVPNLTADAEFLES